MSVPSVRHHARLQGAPSPGRNKAAPRGAQPWVDAKRVLKPHRGHQVTGGSESGVWRGPNAGDFPRALPPPPVFGERRGPLGSARQHSPRVRVSEAWPVTGPLLMEYAHMQVHVWAGPQRWGSRALPGPAPVIRKPRACAGCILRTTHCKAGLVRRVRPGVLEGLSPQLKFVGSRAPAYFPLDI